MRIQVVASCLVGLLLGTCIVRAQEETSDVPDLDDVLAPVEAPAVTPTDDPTEPVDGVEGEDVDVAVELNVSEALRVSRLAQASGMTEDEVRALREGETTLDGSEPTGRTVGWGKLVKSMGFHPGILGHGTGDKFMPPPPEPEVPDASDELEAAEALGDELPELPEIDEDAVEVIKSARERAMDRKTERKAVHAARKAAKKADVGTAESASVSKGAGKSSGKPEKSNRGQTKEKRGKARGHR